MLAIAVASALALAQVPPPRGDNSAIEARAKLWHESAAIIENETARLETLAQELRKAGKTADAETVEGRIEPISPPDGPIRFVPLPDVASEGSKDFPALQKIRSESAQALLALALRAAAADNDALALADQCLRKAIEREPDDPETRRLLGFVRYKDGWATPEAAKNLKENKVRDPKFGWVPADWVAHLRQGELPDIIQAGRPVRWLPAEEADSLRSQAWNKDTAWKITTDHFFIRANVPLNEAIAFGRRLEDLHEVFFSTCADVIGRNLPLAKRLRTPKLWATPAVRKHEVWYFASKDEYVRYFLKRFRRTEDQSLGYYMPQSEARGFQDTPKSYFYRDATNPISVDETLFHEGSHQLLFESAGATNFGRNRGNFWVWEGLGTYFETFVAQDDGSYLLGGVTGARMEKAKDDIVFKKQLVPTAQLVAMGQSDFLAEPGVYLNYAESMALAVFLMQYDHGRYRERFLDYVASAYHGRLRTDVSGTALAERLKVPYEQLDIELTEFLSGGAKPQVGN